MTRAKRVHQHELHASNTLFYYNSRLVRALFLVILAGGILLYAPLKFAALFVAKLFRDLSTSVLNFYSK